MNYRGTERRLRPRELERTREANAAMSKVVDRIAKAMTQRAILNGQRPDRAVILTDITESE